MHLFSLPFELLHHIVHNLLYPDLWTLSSTCHKGRQIAFELIDEKYHLNLTRPIIINPYAHLVHVSLAHLTNPDRMARQLTSAMLQRTPTTYPESLDTLEFLLVTTLNIIISVLPYDFPLENLAMFVHHLDRHLVLSTELTPPLARILMSTLQTRTTHIQPTTAFVCHLLNNDTLKIEHARAFATHTLPRSSLPPDHAMRLLLDIVHATQLKTPQPGDLLHLTALVRLLQDSFTLFHTSKST